MLLKYLGLNPIRYYKDKKSPKIDGIDIMTKFSKRHGEPSDCSGYRGVVEGMTRRRKDEVVETIKMKIEELNELLYSDGRKDLSLSEMLLMAWRIGLIEGRAQGRESTLAMQDFKKRHGIAESDSLPSPKKMLEMEKAWLKSNH